MNYQQIEQLSPEWWQLKVGKVSGTRFGQIISGRENMLIDEMANEILDGYCEMDDFESEDMLFGKENEPIAIDLYEAQSGLKFERGGVIVSEINPDIHMASPDGITLDCKIIVEVKCTQSGKIQINRFRKGVESKNLPQIINYFAVSNKVEEVHWISYCPFRPEIELVVHIFKRGTIIETKVLKSGTTVTTIQDKVNEGLAQLPNLQSELNLLIEKIKF
jgi:hypothetical protein